jgi:hypothetical protein
VISELEFLPTPLIAVNARRVATAAGVTFDGTAQLSQVSARYSEANINALFPTELAQGQQSFIEVRLDARDGANPVLRRYTVVDIPEICPLKFEWRARLEIQQDDRDRFTKKVDPLTFYPARMREET